MNLGILAVGIVIFLFVGVMLTLSIECKDMYAGVSMAIIFVTCLYCAISGAYLLHLVGHI